MIRERHRLLYEPNEKRFYRYEQDTGLWTPQTAASLEQVACELVNTESKSNEDVIKHAQLASHLSISTRRLSTCSGDFTRPWPQSAS